MKKLITILLAVGLSLVASGCIVSVDPTEEPVFVYPGTTKAFKVSAIASSNDLVWFLDEAEVQSGGDVFEYTAPQDDGTTSHTILVKLLSPLGEFTHTWNINTDSDVAPSSPNNPHIPPGPGPWFEGWYTRVSDVAGSRSIAIIGASSLPRINISLPDSIYPGPSMY